MPVLVRILAITALSSAAAAFAYFWVGALTTKGGERHRFSGRLFARFLYAAVLLASAVAVAGIAMPDVLIRTELARPESLRALPPAMWALLYAGIVAAAAAQHGIAVVAAAEAPAALRSRAHAALNLAAIMGSPILLAAAVAWAEFLFLLLPPLGFAIGLSNAHYASGTKARRDDWEREHLTGMLAAGGVLHTTLMVLASRHWPGAMSTGFWQAMVWIGPALVTGPVIVWLRSRR